MSDTPRTDGMEPYGPPYNATPIIHVPKAFARQLERELTESKRLALAGYELLEAIREKLGLAKLIDIGAGSGVSDIGYVAYSDACEKLKGGTK